MSSWMESCSRVLHLHSFGMRNGLIITLSFILSNCCPNCRQVFGTHSASGIATNSNSAKSTQCTSSAPNGNVFRFSGTFYSKCGHAQATASGCSQCTFELFDRQSQQGREEQLRQNLRQYLEEWQFGKQVQQSRLEEWQRANQKGPQPSDTHPLSNWPGLSQDFSRSDQSDYKAVPKQIKAPEDVGRLEFLTLPQIITTSSTNASSSSDIRCGPFPRRSTRMNPSSQSFVPSEYGRASSFQGNERGGGPPDPSPSNTPVGNGQRGINSVPPTSRKCCICGQEGRSRIPLDAGMHLWVTSRVDVSWVSQPSGLHS